MKYLAKLYSDSNIILGNFSISFSEILCKLKEFQIIVKINSITDGSNGTHWHLEDMSYENIVSTGIYYKEIKNMDTKNMDTKILFRSPRSLLFEDFDYPQNDHFGIINQYGFQNVYSHMHDNTNFSEEYKPVSIYDKMCMVFPNYLQHKVLPYTKIDINKKAMRNTIVFFLVNPNTRILSTRDILISCNDIKNGKSFEDAKKIIKELKNERSHGVNIINKTIFERTISLCEY